jgi:hypothetical protein
MSEIPKVETPEPLHTLPLSPFHRRHDLAAPASLPIPSNRNTPSRKVMTALLANSAGARAEPAERRKKSRATEQRDQIRRRRNHQPDAQRRNQLGRHHGVCEDNVGPDPKSRVVSGPPPVWVSPNPHPSVSHYPHPRRLVRGNTILSRAKFRIITVTTPTGRRALVHYRS